MPVLALLDETLGVNVANVVLALVTLGLLGYFAGVLVYGLIAAPGRSAASRRAPSAPVAPARLRSLTPAHQEAGSSDSGVAMAAPAEERLGRSPAGAPAPDRSGAAPDGWRHGATGRWVSPDPPKTVTWRWM